jgi:transcriptional regulator with XRE-family HTH domain
MSIGCRLKEERERLGLSQADFAAIGGASKRSQIEWEKENAYPNAAFLAAIAAEGVDVTYILTGIRSGAVPAQSVAEVPEELSQREKVLVAKWRMLPPAEQDDIEEIVEKIEQAQALKRKHGKAPRKAG